MTNKNHIQGRLINPALLEVASEPYLDAMAEAMLRVDARKRRTSTPKCRPGNKPCGSACIPATSKCRKEMVATGLAIGAGALAGAALLGGAASLAARKVNPPGLAPLPPAPKKKSTTNSSLGAGLAVAGVGAAGAATYLRSKSKPKGKATEEPPAPETPPAAPTEKAPVPPKEIPIDWEEKVTPPKQIPIEWEESVAPTKKPAESKPKASSSSTKKEEVPKPQEPEPKQEVAADPVKAESPEPVQKASGEAEKTTKPKETKPKKTRKAIDPSAEKPAEATPQEKKPKDMGTTGAGQTIVKVNKPGQSITAETSQEPAPREEPKANTSPISKKAQEIQEKLQSVVNPTGKKPNAKTSQVLIGYASGTPVEEIAKQAGVNDIYVKKVIARAKEAIGKDVDPDELWEAATNKPRERKPKEPEAPVVKTKESDNQTKEATSSKTSSEVAQQPKESPQEEPQKPKYSRIADVPRPNSIYSAKIRIQGEDHPVMINALPLQKGDKGKVIEFETKPENINDVREYAEDWIAALNKEDMRKPKDSYSVKEVKILENGRIGVEFQLPPDGRTKQAKAEKNQKKTDAYDRGLLDAKLYLSRMDRGVPCGLGWISPGEKCGKGASSRPAPVAKVKKLSNNLRNSAVGRALTMPIATGAMAVSKAKKELEAAAKNAAQQAKEAHRQVMEEGHGPETSIRKPISELIVLGVGALPPQVAPIASAAARYTTRVWDENYEEFAKDGIGVKQISDAAAKIHNDPDLREEVYSSVATELVAGTAGAIAGTAAGNAGDHKVHVGYWNVEVDGPIAGASSGISTAQGYERSGSNKATVRAVGATVQSVVSKLPRRRKKKNDSASGRIQATHRKAYSSSDWSGFAVNYVG